VLRDPSLLKALASLPKAKADLAPRQDEPTDDAPTPTQEA
jgi:hypothetical protein